MFQLALACLLGSLGLLGLLMTTRCDRWWQKLKDVVFVNGLSHLSHLCSCGAIVIHPDTSCMIFCILPRRVNGLGKLLSCLIFT